MTSQISDAYHSTRWRRLSSRMNTTTWRIGALGMLSGLLLVVLFTNASRLRWHRIDFDVEVRKKLTKTDAGTKDIEGLAVGKMRGEGGETAMNTPPPAAAAIGAVAGKGDPAAPPPTFPEPHKVPSPDPTTPTSSTPKPAESPDTGAPEEPPCWSVLWLVRKKWEQYYIDDMLRGLPICNTKSYDATVELQNRTVIVTSQRVGPEAGLNQIVMEQCVRRNLTFVVFLISEESEPDSASCSRPDIKPMIDSSALLVRNYWTHDCHQLDKVVVVPLFVTTRAHPGFLQHCGDHFGRDPANRTTLFFFSSGHVLPERTQLVEAVLEAQRQLNTTADAVQLNYRSKSAGLSYSQVMSDARYAAVVTGNVEETWRFTESLFCGAVPFMQQKVYEYYRHWLPSDLMDLLPWYKDNDPESIREEFLKIANLTREAYVQHANSVYKAAKEWFSSTQGNLVSRIQMIS